MIPLILESSSSDQLDLYLRGFFSEHKITSYNVLSFRPEGKEFSIREVRDIIGETLHHTAEMRAFILYNFDSSSIEAQNAFLKTLEEHQPNIIFVLAVNHAARLLPTIRSRSKIVILKEEVQSNHVNHSINFNEPSESNPLKSFARSSNSVTKADIPKTLQSLQNHYRSRLSTDRLAPSILKEIVLQQNLVTYNNLDPQTALDSILLRIGGTRTNQDENKT